jgi:hypothetical protein
MNRRERAEKFVTSEPWCTTECPECGVQHTDIPRLQKQEDALVAQFGEVEAEALERAAKIASHEAYDDAAGNRVARLIRALKEKRDPYVIGGPPG